MSKYGSKLDTDVSYTKVICRSDLTPTHTRVALCNAGLSLKTFCATSANH